MTTATIVIDPIHAPGGTVCRIYHADNSAYLGETISDGTGVLVFGVAESLLGEVQVETMPDGYDGAINAPALKITVE